MLANEIYIKVRESHAIERSKTYEMVLAYSERTKCFGFQPMVGYVLKERYDELERKYQELLKKTNANG